MRDGATAGYRYFDFGTARSISVTTRGTAEGCFIVRDGLDGNTVARIPVQPSGDWQTFTAPLAITPGRHPLYFTYEGAGWADLFSFTLA